MFPILAFACAPEEEPPAPCDTAPPPALVPCADPYSVEVGVGTYGVNPLSDHPESPHEIELTHGPAGGWYVDLSGTLAGSVDSVGVTGEVRHAVTGEVIATTPEVFLELANYRQCWGQFWSLRTYLAADAFDQEAVCNLDGAPLEVTVTVREVFVSSDPYADPTFGEQDDDVGYGIAVVDRVDLEACASL